MDYFSTLQNLGGLANDYQTDITTRFGDMNIDNQLQNQYSNAMGQWDNGVEALKNQGLDELKEWGIEAGSEIGSDMLLHAYAGSALQGAVNDAMASAKSSIQGGLESAFNAVKSGASDIAESVGGVVNEFGTAITSGASDLATQFMMTPMTAPPASTDIEMTDLAPTPAPAPTEPATAETTTTTADTTADATTATADTTAETSGTEIMNPAFSNDATETSQLQRYNPPEDVEGTETADIAPSADVAPTTANVAPSAEVAPQTAEIAPSSAPAPAPAPATPASSETNVESASSTAQQDTLQNTDTANTYESAMTDYNAGDYSGASNLEADMDAPEAGGSNVNADGTDYDVGAVEEGGLEDLAGDAIADVATSGFGLGEVMMVGQIAFGLGKALYDMFDPPKPPPPPTMPTMIQVPQLPTYIQASVQSGV